MLTNSGSTQEEGILLNCSKIHEPCFPYFGSVYMTLLSVMQGIVLASIVLPFAYFFKEKSIEAILFVPVLVFSVVLWHKYVNHHQILGWQLGPMDTVIVTSFGLLQAFMVNTVIKNYQGITSGKYILVPLVFDHQVISILTGVTISSLLGAFAYAHAGSKASEKYVKAVIVAHYNSCPKYKQRDSHCILQPEELYNLLIGFETWCLIGSFKITLYSFANLVLYLISTRLFEVKFIASSFCSVVLFLIVYCYFLWKYDFKRVISNREIIYKIKSLGETSLGLTNQWNNKLLCWFIIIPSSSLDFSISWLEKKLFNK